MCLPLSIVHISISKHIFACFLLFRDFSRYFEIFRDVWDFLSDLGCSSKSFPLTSIFSIEIFRDFSKYFEIFRDFSNFFEIFWDFGSFFFVLNIFSKKHVESQNRMFSLPTKAYRSKIPPIHGAERFWRYIHTYMHTCIHTSTHAIPYHTITYHNITYHTITFHCVALRCIALHYITYTRCKHTSHTFIRICKYTTYI